MEMMGLELPNRSAKPRETGWTLLIDTGMATSQFIDVIESHHRLIDAVKFGWGTALVTDQLDAKIACLRAFGVDYFFGGTLFEKFYSQGRVERFWDFCRFHRCPLIEISDGTITLDRAEKGRMIREFSRYFRVLSEVGYKDSDRSNQLSPDRWISLIQSDLSAGAEKVITEARESGTSGICRSNGEIRDDLIEAILASGIPSDRLVFEAPNKAMQVFFLRRVGPNVNLANVAMHDAVGVETLRLGLRSDTLLLWDEDKAAEAERISEGVRSIERVRPAVSALRVTAAGL